MSRKKGETGFPHSEATKEKIRLAKIGKPGHLHTPESREKIGAAQRGKKRRPHTEETKRKIGHALLGNQNLKGVSPSVETRQKIAEANRGQKRSAESVEKMREAKRQYWENPENRERQRQRLLLSNPSASPAVREKMRHSAILRAEREGKGEKFKLANPMFFPEIRAKISGDLSPTKRPEVRAKIGAAHRTRNANRETSPGRYFSRAFRKTSLDRKVETLLEQIAPRQFEYVGTGKFWIGRCCPDFIDRERKLVVEAFGEYWHRGDDGAKRKALFASQGWSTFIVREEDLRTQPAIVQQAVLAWVAAEGRQWQT